MSEYQYVAFRAIDRPLTDDELEYAHSQSTRAEITRWSFENEYHYGDFRGSAKEMLTRGFDVYLHYANFGIRRIMLRLPAGLPFKKSVWSKYIDGGTLTWAKDKRGSAGILTVHPYYDGGCVNEIWGADQYVGDVVAARNELVTGDNRALYALWLCGCLSDYSEQSVTEPPVPAGLGQMQPFWHDLLEFFGLDGMMLDAAAEKSPMISEQSDQKSQLAAWLEQLPERNVRKLLQEFALGNAAEAKADVMKRFRDESRRASTATTGGMRTVEQLVERAEQLRDEEDAKEKLKQAVAAEREAKRKEAARQKRMQEMVKAPQKWLKEADKLVALRGTSSYMEAAEILADLREAIGGEKGDRITLKHAAHLAKRNPTLNHLKSSLRKRGLLPK